MVINDDVSIYCSMSSPAHSVLIVNVKLTWFAVLEGGSNSELNPHNSTVQRKNKRNIG